MAPSTHTPILKQALKRLLVQARAFRRQIVWREGLTLFFLAVAIGIASGLASIAFRTLLGVTQFLFYGSMSERLASRLAELAWWQVALGPALGGLLIGFMLKHLLGGKRAEGVPHVMEAAALRGGRMNLDSAIRSAIVSACSLGVGASTGREGPVVHLGGALASRVAQALHLPANASRSLLGCGVAAAVAASFNAPIAGVFFALEVVVGHYALSAFAPVVLASIAGTMVSRAYYGDYPAFVLPNYEITTVFELPAFALLGVTSAVVAGLFLLSVRIAERLFDIVDPPIVLRPALAGLCIGLIAVAFPHVLGVGYEGTDAAINEQLTLGLMFLLIIAKNIASAISLAGGFGGGVFSPSLFLGAMTGGVFGILATGVFPEMSGSHGAYTLVGMGAVAGAVLGAPISTILIVFEMTGDYELTVAVMVGVVVCVTLVQQFIGGSYFDWQLAARGINLESGRDVGLLSEMYVADVMKRSFAHVPEHEPAEVVAQRLKTARYGFLFVTARDGTLLGTIALPDLVLAMDQAGGDQAGEDRDGEAPEGKSAAHHGLAGKTARDFARRAKLRLAVGDTLETAMRRMDESGESHVAVVDDRESGRLVGIVHEHDVMVAYHRALLTARKGARSMGTGG